MACCSTDRSHFVCYIAPLPLAFGCFGAQPTDMALRPASLAALSRRVMASHSMVATRSGGGGPIALGRPPSQPVSTQLPDCDIRLVYRMQKFSSFASAELILLTDDFAVDRRG